MKRSYEPALDGLRAFAALVVVGHHCAPAWFPGGFYGVDVFFVLSGYLITSILLSEERPSFAGFYVRRLRRLVPALLAMVGGFAILAPFLSAEQFGRYDFGAIGALTYTTNYLPHSGWINPLDHTWSLASEMQFYLAWPFVVVMLRRWSRPLAVAILACAYLLVWSARVNALTSSGDWHAGYFALHTHSSGLFVGAALAFFPARFIPLRTATWAALASLLILVISPLHETVVWRGEIFGTAAAEGLAAVMIAGLLQNAPAGAMLGAPILRRLGELSYGVYLWHFPISRALSGLGPAASLAATLSASLALAAISSATVERWGKRVRLAPA